MNALKIFTQIILICLLLAMPSISQAELQGKLYGGNGFVAENGETFNVGEFRKALDYQKNIDAAESIYNDFVVPIVAQNFDGNSNLKQSILWHQAKYYSSIRQFQKALEIYERLLVMPINNDKKISILVQMAESNRCLNHCSKALEYILQAWSIYEKNLPEDKIVRILILKNMSLIHSDIGNAQEALTFAQEAFDLSVEIYGYYSQEAFDARTT